MPLPAFTETGDLPVGVHTCSLGELLARFGSGTSQRQRVGQQLEWVYDLVVSAGHLRSFNIFGSFVTDKPEPGDVDVFLIMDDSFDVSTVTGEAWIVFQHLLAQTHFGASIFWVRRQAALGGEAATVEYWQIKRDGTERGIVQVTGR